MTLSLNVRQAVDGVVGTFIEQIAAKYDIDSDELHSLWNGESSKGVTNVAPVEPPTKSCGAREELMRCKKVELQVLCKEKGLKCTGTKKDLVDLLLDTPSTAPAKGPAKKEPVKKPQPSLVAAKLTANVPTIAIRRNQFSNYEHPETSLVFDKKTKKVIGQQNDDGTIEDLNTQLIELCNKHKFDYELPEDLDKKSTLEDVEIEELEELEEVVESDDAIDEEELMDDEELDEDLEEEFEEELDD